MDVAVTTLTKEVQVGGASGKMRLSYSTMEPRLLLKVTATVMGVALFKEESTTTKDWPLVVKRIGGGVVIAYLTCQWEGLEEMA